MGSALILSRNVAQYKLKNCGVGADRTSLAISLTGNMSHPLYSNYRLWLWRQLSFLGTVLSS